MKITAIIVNVILFIFNCVVLVTEGPPKEASYIVFTGWVLLTLILSTAAISRMKDNPPSIGALFKIVAIVCNIVFLIFVCWAIIDQYPHPEEAGVIEFTVLMVLTPILNLLVLFRGGASNVWRSLHLKWH